jgi:hypothetical protein
MWAICRLSWGNMDPIIAHRPPRKRTNRSQSRIAISCTSSRAVVIAARHVLTARSPSEIARRALPKSSRLLIRTRRKDGAATAEQRHNLAHEPLAGQQIRRDKPPKLPVYLREKEACLSTSSPLAAGRTGLLSRCNMDISLVRCTPLKKWVRQE